MSTAMTVTRLYELCEVLDAAKDNLEEKSADYLSILSGAKAGSNEKRLTAQLIGRYFHKLPAHQDAALDALFSLCEDDDVTIRKSVIKDLPALCRQQGPHVAKVADVLTQLLQSDDASEHTLVQNSLVHLMSQHPKDTLATVFGHIANAEEDLIRERAVKFLALKLKALSSLTKELESYVFEQSKKIMEDVTGEEFILFMHILTNLPHLQSVTGRQQLLDLVTAQADLDKPFDLKDPNRVDQVCQCFRQALPYFSRNVSSARFVDYMLAQVLPALDGADCDAAARLDLVRVTAELAPHCSTPLDDADAKIGRILTRLLAVLPLPPSETRAEQAENEKDTDDPNVQFSDIECLLWALHQLCRRHTAFLTSAARVADAKELRKRLQYLARVIQVYAGKLRAVLRGKPKTELASDENKIKLLALRTTSNISALTKDLLHTPPIYKATIAVSWRPANAAKANESVSPAKVASPPKRTAPTADEAARKAARKDVNDRALYQPPGGKFSDKAGSFPDESAAVQPQSGGRGRGGRARGRF